FVNENLRTENENLLNVIIDVATKFNNSEERNSQQRKIIQDITTVLFQNEELKIIIERDRYSSFNSAANASEPKIYEITENSPLLYTYLFCQIDDEAAN
ncbi:37251_t:CDS:2, partial [Gigaspora margarita]